MGGTCPNNCCCWAWNIGVEPESADKYKNLDGRYGEWLRGNLVENGEDVFIRMKEMENGCVCAFLTEEHLCALQQKLGEEYLCATCRSYPRDFCIFGDVEVANLMPSCPEVMRILLEHTEPVQFWMEDISQKGEDDCISDMDWEWFNLVMGNFTASITLMQNRSFSLSARLRSLVLFCDALENHDTEKGERDSLFEIFSDEDNLRELLAEHSSSWKGIEDKINVFMVFYDKLHTDMRQRLPHICVDNLRDTLGMEAFCEGYYSRYTCFLENYCVYFLSRYFLSDLGGGPGKAWTKVELLVYMLNIHQCYLYFQTDGSLERLTQEMLADTFVRISRVIEHGQFEKNLRVCYTQEEGIVPKLLSLI